MCGRYTLRTPAREIAEFFQVLREWDTPVQPRFNIAPTQRILAVRRIPAGREAAWLRWGLIPHWAKDPAIGMSCINARSEDVATKRAYRTPFRRSRCLVVADGFYEWEKVTTRKKVPVLFSLLGDNLFAFAGLMDHWTSPAGDVVETCTILTTAANSLVQPVHHRMPVILPPSSYDLWLDPQQQEVEALQPLLVPFPAEAMRAERVSDVINRAGVEVDPRLPPTSTPRRPRQQSLFDEDFA